MPIIILYLNPIYGSSSIYLFITHSYQIYSYPARGYHHGSVPGLTALTLDMKRCTALLQEDGTGANPDWVILTYMGKLPKWIGWKISFFVFDTP